MKKLKHTILQTTNLEEFWTRGGRLKEVVYQQEFRPLCLLDNKQAVFRFGDLYSNFFLCEKHGVELLANRRK